MVPLYALHLGCFWACSNLEGPVVRPIGTAFLPACIVVVTGVVTGGTDIPLLAYIAALHAADGSKPEGGWPR